MCQYFNINRLPKFIVLRPESENRFFQFPLAYRKSAWNLWQFSVAFWSEAYTQFEFPSPGESVITDDWDGYIKGHLRDMLEESAGFFIDWGFEFVPYYQLLIMTLFLLFGPCLMCMQTWRMYKWIDTQKKKDQSKDVEDDPDFVQEEDTGAEGNNGDNDADQPA